MEDSGESKWTLKSDACSETFLYCCSACDCSEEPFHGKVFRNRTKARSMSVPSAPSSAKFRRTQSLHGPSPVTIFGPKACMLKNPKSVVHIQDPASQRLTWSKPPKSVLIIKKIRDSSLLQPFKELCSFLTQQKNMIVYVERKVIEDPAIANDSFVSKKNICTFREDYDDISNCVDFIICLGGDGTLLYASSLFQASVPPVMAFHLGSLGFLTPFKFDTFQSQVTQVIEGNAAIILRSRLEVKVVKEYREKGSVDEMSLVTNGNRTIQYQIMLSRDARNTAWVSLDGRKRQEIAYGESITITTSCFPVPSICFRDPVNDWFESLAQCLHWNVRKKQSHLSSEEEEF
ncbi:NAD kinase isoform X3 [Puntigrus tetrazona]|uniref:NAD kinase isoform X3 n=1 Tax=Puntigrus tetrazona TaxID=1606681 RepID=UPI001C89D73E|nr:NAD kinase isoform X3 [Puntigrus tetrazona]